MEAKLSVSEVNVVANGAIADYERSPRAKGTTRVDLYGLKVDVNWTYEKDDTCQYGVWVGDIEPIEEGVYLKYNQMDLYSILYIMNEHRFPGPYNNI